VSLIVFSDLFIKTNSSLPVYKKKKLVHDITYMKLLCAATDILSVLCFVCRVIFVYVY